MISEVFNEDCMIGMARYPDKYFDLAVVDPPYGIDITKSNRIATSRGMGGKLWDDSIPNKQYFDELVRLSKHQIIWGGNYFNLPPTKCFIIWDKRNDGRDFADCEFAYTSFNFVARIYRMRPMNMDGGKIHPTQKPVKLYEWIYANYAEQGMKVLDTHLGSGSNRIAADKAGMDFIGFELDKDYFEAQEKRWRNYKAQLTLF
jgi:site-specific DNA-methyltransferase (adenine-specific)